MEDYCLIDGKEPGRCNCRFGFGVGVETWFFERHDELLKRGLYIVRSTFCAALGRGEHCVRSKANTANSPYAGCGGGIEITMGADTDQYARTEDEFGRDAGFRSGTKLREPQCCGNTAMATAAANAMRRERAHYILQHTVLKQT